jgi:hypothetical protein
MSDRFRENPQWFPGSNFRFPYSNLAEDVFSLAPDSTMVPAQQPKVAVPGVSTFQAAAAATN